MRDEGEELGNRRGRALQMDKDLSPQMQRGDGRWIETGSLQGYNVTVHGHDFHSGCEGYLTLSFLKQTSMFPINLPLHFLCHIISFSNIHPNKLLPPAPANTSVHQQTTVHFSSLKLLKLLFLQILCHVQS